MIVSLKETIKELEEDIIFQRVSPYVANAKLLVIVKMLDERIDMLQNKINDNGMAQALGNAPGR